MEAQEQTQEKQRRDEQTKIRLNGNLDPTVVQFCSKVDLTMKKEKEDKDLVQEIFIRKKKRIDRRLYFLKSKLV